MATPENQVERKTQFPADVEIISSYVDQLGLVERFRADYIAREISTTDNPLAQTIVAIPVASHQESPQIYNALKQYAKQKDCDPFSIVLDLNTPSSLSDTQKEEAQRTKDEIERAKLVFPWLDIRTFEVEYEKPNMGQIRRDLWNGIAVAYLLGGDPEKPPVVLNQDIDLVYMSEKAISRVQELYYEFFVRGVGSHIFTAGLTMNHAPNYDFPNISGAVAWNDFVHRKTNGTFEAGIIMALASYAKRGGFNIDAEIGEILDSFSLDKGSYLIVPGAYALTSIRRYLDRMPDFGFNIWRHPESVFSAEDDCRVKKDFVDISQSQKEQIIDVNLQLELEEILRFTIVDFLNLAIARRSIFNFEETEVPEAEQIEDIKKLYSELFDRQRKVIIRTLKKIGVSHRQLKLASDVFDLSESGLPETLVQAFMCFDNGDLDAYRNERVDLLKVSRPNLHSLDFYTIDGCFVVEFLTSEEESSP